MKTQDGPDLLDVAFIIITPLLVGIYFLAFILVSLVQVAMGEWRD